MKSITDTTATLVVLTKDPMIFPSELTWVILFISVVEYFLI